MEDRGHEVRIENSGEDSLKDYQEVFQQVTLNSDPMEHIQPYDSVVLDYKIPKINAIEVGKDILLLTQSENNFCFSTSQKIL